MEPFSSSRTADAEPLVPVARYRTLKRAQDHALVVQAMGLPSRIDPIGGAFRFELLVPPENIGPVAQQLDAYDSEQRENRKAPPPFEPPTYAYGWWVALVWATSLFVVFYLQGSVEDLTATGASSSRGLWDDHEWWRPFTALFLHGDLHHLLGNLAIGLTFGVLVSRSLGPLFGWGLILLGGVLGNLATSWAHYPESYTSVGASTAVFAALGILVGYAVYLATRAPSRQLWGAIMAPIGGGLALLGWFGAGGGTTDGTTDVLAHLFGFVAGLLLGATGAWIRLLRPLRESRRPGVVFPIDPTAPAS